MTNTVIVLLIFKKQRAPCRGETEEDLERSKKKQIINASIVSATLNILNVIQLIFLWLFVNDDRIQNT